MMLFLKILLLALPLMQANGNWQHIKTNEQISFLFPNAPQKLNKMMNGIPSTIYQTKDITCAMGVVCSDISAKNITMTPETAQILYEELKKGSLQLETAILKNEITVPYEQMLIKEIEYRTFKDKFEMTYFKRFIFRDKYIYQITIGGRSRHRDIIEAEKDIFFNSVTFPENNTSH